MLLPFKHLILLHVPCTLPSHMVFPKSRMNNIMNNAFKHKNGAKRYTHIKVVRNKSYFTNDHLNSANKYAANDICKMIEFLVDNIYVRFGGQLS